MFQTELHRWFQSFDSPLLRFAMQAVSMLGEEEFYTLLIMVLLFGIDRHRGFIMMQIILWTAILTAALKDTFALPRPVDVDSLVVDYTNAGSHPSPFLGRGAPGFLAPLPDDVVAYYRNVPDLLYGFPSGHCSSSIATWGSLALLFRRSWLAWCTLALVFLMPLSRIYLGRHFLADVLGGLFLGVLVLLFVASLQRGRVIGPGKPEEYREHAPFLSFAETVYLFVLPIAAIIFVTPAREESAVLLGLNTGYILSGRLKALDLPRTVIKRVLGVVLATAVFLVLLEVQNVINTLIQDPHTLLIVLAERTVLATLVVVVTHWLIKKYPLSHNSAKTG